MFADAGMKILKDDGQDLFRVDGKGCQSVCKNGKIGLGVGRKFSRNLFLHDMEMVVWKGQEETLIAGDAQNHMRETKR